MSKIKLYLLIAALILLLCFILSFTLFRNFSINPFFEDKFVTKTITKVSSINLSQYRSLDYYHKSLFPYDFIKGEPNWGVILYKDESFLTVDDIFNKNLYLKAREIGIDTNKNKAFFIIETKSTYGFSLEDYIKDSLLRYDYTNKIITIREPKTQLLYLEIIDETNKLNSQNLKITPGEWRDIVALILPLITEEVESKNLIEISHKRNKDFLETIYKNSGWEVVEFK
jgi:hypothetical protein